VSRGEHAYDETEDRLPRGPREDTHFSSHLLSLRGRPWFAPLRRGRASKRCVQPCAGSHMLSSADLRSTNVENKGGAPRRHCRHRFSEIDAFAFLRPLLEVLPAGFFRSQHSLVSSCSAPLLCYIVCFLLFAISLFHSPLAVLTIHPRVDGSYGRRGSHSRWAIHALFWPRILYSTASPLHKG